MGAEIHWDNAFMFAGREEEILADQSLRQKKTIIDKWKVPPAVLFAYRDLLLFKRYM